MAFVVITPVCAESRYLQQECDVGPLREVGLLLSFQTLHIATAVVKVCHASGAPRLNRGPMQLPALPVGKRVLCWHVQ